MFQVNLYLQLVLGQNENEYFEHLPCSPVVLRGHCVSKTIDVES